MPWNKVKPMLQRKELIEKLLLPEANVSKLCFVYNISRKTAYKWLNRYKKGSLSELNDQNKTPYHSPNKVDAIIEELIVEKHKEYPYWGPRKLRNLLINEKTFQEVPSVSTFARVFKRNQCEVIKSQKSNPAKKRFERTMPNELWQMDFKGSFMTRAHRCYPLTIIDDYSRYSIGLKACRNEQSRTVQDCLTPISTSFKSTLA